MSLGTKPMNVTTNSRTIRSIEPARMLDLGFSRAGQILKTTGCSATEGHHLILAAKKMRAARKSVVMFPTTGHPSRNVIRLTAAPYNRSTGRRRQVALDTGARDALRRIWLVCSQWRNAADVRLPASLNYSPEYSGAPGGDLRSAGWRRLEQPTPAQTVVLTRAAEVRV